MPRRSDRFVKCTIKDCEQPLVARGWCKVHYYRWKRQGTPFLQPESAPDLYEQIKSGVIKAHGKSPVEVRFWTNVDKDGPVHPLLGTTCWLWTGYLVNGNYGMFKVNSHPTLVHRYSWERINGPIPNDLCVLHKCDVRNCVFPEHLFLGTSQENMEDMMAKGRQCRGERNSHAVLDESKVLEIRRLHTLDPVRWSGCLLAKKFNMSSSSIYLILNEKNWRHI